VVSKIQYPESRKYPVSPHFLSSGMKRILLAALITGSLFRCSDKPELHWYKGNLHTHSYWSDGDGYPEMIMDWYKTNGYHFVGLSDHNILAEGEKWIVVQKSPLYEEAFNKYLDKYGDRWVKYKNDTGRTQVKLKTYLEYKYLFEDDNFLIIKSEEITDKFGDKPIHMNVTNVLSLIQPQGGSSVTEVMQRNVDAVLKQREETGVPMFPHLNHPNFYYAVSAQDMIDLRGERFFEVYNGHPLVHNDGDSLHLSTEDMWDNINMAYHEKGQPLLFGLATDDSHNYHQFGSSYSNAGRGWVMVQTDSLTPASLIRAMEAGRFYSSTGVTLKSLSTENNTIELEIEPESGVTYTIEFIGPIGGEALPHILKTVNGTEAKFEVQAALPFVRARIISSKIKSNPFKEGEFEMAWTQPVTYQAKK
jgi:hypothetical protein